MENKYNDELERYEKSNLEILKNLLVLDVELSDDNIICMTFSPQPMLKEIPGTDKFKCYYGYNRRGMHKIARFNEENKEEIRKNLCEQIEVYLEYMEHYYVKDKIKSLRWMYRYPLCILTALLTVLTQSTLVFGMCFAGVLLVEKYNKQKIIKEKEQMVTPYTKFYSIYSNAETIEEEKEHEKESELEKSNTKELTNSEEKQISKGKEKVLVKRKKRR